MRIAVDAIPDEGIDVEAGLLTPWAERAAAEALEGLVIQLAAKLHVELRGRYVHVDGSAHVVAEVACNRCGHPARLALVPSFQLTYGPPGVDPALDEDVELTDLDLDAGFYEDGALDLATVLSEALALELPARVVCTDLAPCEARTAALLGAPAPGGHPGFAGLADLVKR